MHVVLIALIMGVLGTVTGCATTPHQPVTTHATDSADKDASVVALVTYARRLSQTTPAGRANAVRLARHQAHKTPGAVTYAHLALALASPHQKLYTPDEAARYAHLALNAKPAPWNADARQYLGDMARWMTLATGHDNMDTARIHALQSQLDAAQAKLKAVSDIESRIQQNAPAQ